MARETDDILMTPELAEYFGAMGFAAARSTTRPGMRGLGEEPTAIAVNTVQKGLNYLTRAGLAVDNDYGLNTTRALTSWIMSLPAAARASYSVVPSTDKHWLYIRPGAIATALEEAAAQPARPTTVVGTGTGSVSVAQAANALQNHFNAAPGLNAIIETYARAHGSQVPTAASSAYLAWYRSMLGVRDIIVAKLRSSAPLAAAIASREGGRTSASQIAAQLASGRPNGPDVPGSGTSPSVELGIWPYVAAAAVGLGYVIVAGGTIYLTLDEARQIVESDNLRARLEAILRALRERVIPPSIVPTLPGGGGAPVEPGHAPPGGTPEASRPFGWVKWLAIGLGVVAAGFVAHKVADVYGEEQQRKGTASSGWKTGRAQRRLSPGA